MYDLSSWQNSMYYFTIFTSQGVPTSLDVLVSIATSCVLNNPHTVKQHGWQMHIIVHLSWCEHVNIDQLNQMYLCHFALAPVSAVHHLDKWPPGSWVGSPSAALSLQGTFKPELPWLLLARPRPVLKSSAPGAWSQYSPAHFYWSTSSLAVTGTASPRVDSLSFFLMVIRLDFYQTGDRGSSLVVTGTASPRLEESSRFINRLQQGQLIRPQSHCKIFNVKLFIYGII